LKRFCAQDAAYGLQIEADQAVEAWGLNRIEFLDQGKAKAEPGTERK